MFKSFKRLRYVPHLNTSGHETNPTAMASALTLAPAPTASAERIDPTTVEDSGCIRARSDNPDSPDYDADSWSITYVNGILTVTWNNYVTQCCPEGFNTWFERDADNLVYNVEDYADILCDCMCPFNVTSTFGTIEPGHYTITFRRYGKIRILCRDRP